MQPVLNIMFQEGDDKFQAEVNRYLNLDKLDVPGRQGGRVTAELFARLCAQGIMEKVKRKKKEEHKQEFTYYIKKKLSMDYRPALFQMPTRLGLSGGEKVTLHILEQLVKTETFFKGNEWKIILQHKNPFKHGFAGWMKYDFALWKGGVLWGLIEFDGIQHHRCVKLWHDKEKKGKKKEIEQFLDLHLKDRIKDADALKLCNGRKCLRLGPRYKGALEQDRIKGKIIKWLYTKIMTKNT